MPRPTTPCCLRRVALSSGLVTGLILSASLAFGQVPCGDWTVVPTQNPPSGHNSLIGLGAWSPDVAYALRGGAAGSFVHQWDGVSWAETSLPDLAVEGLFSPRAITAAGGQAWVASLVAPGSSGNGPYQHLMRWNGSEWDLEVWIELVPDAFGLPRSGSPIDMDGLGNDDIWIVGIADGTGDPNAGTELLTLHWDGSELTEYSTSGPGDRQNWLYGVTSIAPNDAWAVGYYNSTFDGNGSFHAMIYHWDGSGWSRVEQPAEALDGTFLYDIDATGPNDIWAVGDDSGVPLLMHYDGTDWSIVPTPIPSVPLSVHEVAAAAPDNVWAATTDRSVGFLHWDGLTWEIVDFPDVPGSTGIDLHGAMAAVGECDVWAVGGQTVDGRIYTLATRLDTETTGLESGASTPQALRLGQNSPNPFTGTTRVSFDLSDRTDVLLEVFDSAGRLVHSDRRESVPAGPNSLELSGAQLAGGAYYYRLSAGASTETRQMVLVK